MSKTILVVDDEKRLVSLVESYLKQEGYRVATAHNGQEALTAARRDKPDLIVLDVMMPEMDGYEFMRKHRAESNTPIILLTARVDDEEKVVGLEGGVGWGGCGPIWPSAGSMRPPPSPARHVSTARLATTKARKETAAARRGSQPNKPAEQKTAPYAHNQYG